MKRLGMKYCYSYVSYGSPKITFRMYQLNLDGKERVYMKCWNESEVHYIEDI